MAPTIQERLREEIRQFHEGTCYGERPPAEDSGLLEVFQMETGWQAAALIDALINALNKHETALEHAEAVFGGEYADTDAVMFNLAEDAKDAAKLARALLSGGAKP